MEEILDQPESPPFAIKMALKVLVFATVFCPYGLWLIAAKFGGPELAKVFTCRAGLTLVVIAILLNLIGFILLYVRSSDQPSLALFLRWLIVSAIFVLPALLLPFTGCSLLSVMKTMFPAL
jgi:hypothetical protein